ncbi:unnamed protein product [Didymodactylos carnosus]|uniref:Uncharacterized protein n=1 Tax=Didymodactylos carnosus TaxID=1234261 RepID=A0A8S2V3Z0_9BILA|nr:unnamed protein product [Didymodactylos carnosus]CAF4351898.1 unnamed protein product [Didymodactylos carnosus]
MVEALIHIPQNEESKLEMLEECRLEYTDQRDIDNFERHYNTAMSSQWINSKPYADMKHVSVIYDESEVLFSIGTPFQVISIEPLDNDT